MTPEIVQEKLSLSEHFPFALALDRFGLRKRRNFRLSSICAGAGVMLNTPALMPVAQICSGYVLLLGAAAESSLIRPLGAIRWHRFAVAWIILLPTTTTTTNNNNNDNSLDYTAGQTPWSWWCCRC